MNTLEFPKSDQPGALFPAIVEFRLKQGAKAPAGTKLKFVTLQEGDSDERKTHVFAGDEHAAVLAKLLHLNPNVISEADTARVRQKLVSAGIIEDGVVKIGSESIERLFGITEEELRIKSESEAIRVFLQALIPPADPQDPQQVTE